MKNYYEVLEVTPSASEEVIRSAYKSLVKKYHPDVYPGNKEYANEQMFIINEAYEMLSDPDKRKAYDASARINSSTVKSEHTGDTGNPNQDADRSASAATPPSTGRKQKSGCLGGFIKLLIAGVVIYLIVHWGGSLFGGSKPPEVSSPVSSSPAVTETPAHLNSLDEKNDQEIEGLLAEAITIDDEQERLLKFVTALGMAQLELGVKSYAYLHYVEDGEVESERFFKDQTDAVNEIVDVMRQYHSEEIVEAAYLETLSYFLIAEEYAYDYHFGSDWYGKAFDADALWELYLAKLNAGLNEE